MENLLSNKASHKLLCVLESGAQVCWKIIGFLLCEVCTAMWSELEEKETAVFIDPRSTVFIEEQFSLELLVPFHFWLRCRWQSIFEALDKALVWNLEWYPQWTEGQGEKDIYGSMTMFVKKGIKKNVTWSWILEG